MFGRNKAQNSHGTRVKNAFLQKRHLLTNILVLKPEKTLSKVTYKVFCRILAKPGLKQHKIKKELK